LGTNSITRSNAATTLNLARALRADEANVAGGVSRFQLSANYSNIFRATLRPQDSLPTSSGIDYDDYAHDDTGPLCVSRMTARLLVQDEIDRLKFKKSMEFRDMDFW